MEILQLRYFCASAETENFTHTAKKYNVPASNISQSVSRLEKELGTKLFDRNSNKLTLNNQGVEFYKRIKNALILIDDATLAAKESKESFQGEIKLNICTNRRIVTTAIESFRKLYPDVSFLISHNPSDNTDFDFIISDDLSRYEKYEKTLFVDEKILLAANKNTFKNKKKISSLQDLADERFITMSPGTSMYRITAKMSEAGGFVPNIVIQSDDPFYIRKYVSMGLGIAFVPEITWKGLFDDNIEFFDICNCSRKTYIFQKKDRYMPAYTQKFSEHLVNSELL